MYMRTIYLLLLIMTIDLFSMNSLGAQAPKLVYTDASTLRRVGALLPGQPGYHRIDTAAYPDLPAGVKKLLTHSAGLAISFTTNSATIAARWCVTNATPYNNMTAIANKGLDLYIKKDGRWQFAGVGRPDSVCSDAVVVKNMDRSEKECLLYLPLYDELKSLSVGIDEGASIRPGGDPFRKRVLIYGSSIVQGSSASRPGMAYPARLTRQTGVQFLNLGLSGSARMEAAAADLVAAIPADAYVLDCVPNSSPEQVTQRTAHLVRTIRSKHPQAPIILVQSIIRESGYFDRNIGDRVRQQNANMLREFEQLQQQGVTHLYFISAEELLGDDHEGTTDGTHPNDIGFDRMLQVLQPEILKTLKSHKIVL